MHYVRSIGVLLIISLSLFLMTGCQPDDGSTKTPSTPHPNEENKKAVVDVTVGGKVWKINPDLSYQATGVWTNPNPRSLTDAEKSRLKSIQTEAQKLRVRLDELDKQMNVFHRIQQRQIKVRYRFGKPPHLSTGEIFDLGEFPMELENGKFHFQMDPSIQTHSE